ncbi:ABC transporter ATP-binding protein [Sporosarcina koreensis]|uniref:ABC transporter ATP-binding protein n=1 Tax=Sporosarcina koreensis TaxID=334735 RepID=UPI0007569D3D|nr:ABC transporter ATP-binding protein [Sporosarcina koreensis]
MNAIQTVNLTKQYGNRAVVKRIDLTVGEGELYGFLGRNGAGKSTFINMMTGIIHPTEGQVKLLDASNRDDILSQIGVLPDYSSYYDHLTARQHLSYFSSIQGYKLSKNDVDVALEQVGLLEHANGKVGKFSFGMKKKLGIAQAIVHKPKLVFLDEPTSGVDAESSIHIQRLLQRLNNNGMTIFMTSHNLAEVEKICSSIAIMQSGIIADEGTLHSLQKKHSAQMEVTMKVSDDATTLLNAIQQLIGSVVHEGQTLAFRTDDEQRIGDVVRFLVRNGLTVYRIAINQPSLEDIFLKTHKGEREQ